MKHRDTYYARELPEDAKKKMNFGSIRRLIRYAIPYKKVFTLAFILVVTGSVLALVPNLILRYIINDVIPDKNMRKLYMTLIGFFLVAVLQIVIPWVYTILLRTRTSHIISGIRDEFFDKLQSLSFDFFDKRPAGTVSICVTSYIDEISEFFASYLVSFIVNVLQIVIVTVCMVVISPILALVIYSAILPLALCYTLLRRKTKKLFRHLRACDSNRAAFTLESVQGERIIKSFNRCEHNQDLYDNVVHKECFDVWTHTYRLLELFTPIFEFFWNYGFIMLYFISIVCLKRGVVGIDAGTVTLFVSYLGFCAGPFLNISSILQSLASVSSNLERIFNILDAPVTVTEKEEAAVLKDTRGEIDFDDVTFAYEEGNNILEHVNLHVKPGEMIALVGPTGAGKTTMINLLTRFYDVTGGAVLIDGEDIRDFTLHSLRTEIGVIMQDPFLFKGTLMDNIRYGRPDATDEECIKAAEMIHADKLIKRFPDGYQHKIGENGDGLSAGEKQILSMARIVLKNPSVIILDEATSSVDSENEMLIQSALEKVLHGKTSFVVAHRLSTIRKADRILYITNRGIAEEGNHEELMAKKGYYYKLNQRT